MIYGIRVLSFFFTHMWSKFIAKAINMFQNKILDSFPTAFFSSIASFLLHTKKNIRQHKPQWEKKICVPPRGPNQTGIEKVGMPIGRTGRKCFVAGKKKWKRCFWEKKDDINGKKCPRVSLYLLFSLTYHCFHFFPSYSPKNFLSAIHLIGVPPFPIPVSGSVLRMYTFFFFSD